jgi:hypothetical protein
MIFTILVATSISKVTKNISETKGVLLSAMTAG